MPKRLRALSVLLTALAAAGGLAACGSGDSGSTDPEALLKATFSNTKPVKSGKLDLTIGVDAKGATGLNGPISLKLTGPFESTGAKTLPKFSFEAQASLAGQNVQAGAITTGDAAFLTFQGTAYKVPAQVFTAFKRSYEQAAAKSEKDSGTTSFSALGVDPLKWLSDPKTAGDEKVGGADTHHVTATIDVAKLLADINTSLSKTKDLGLPDSAQLPTQLTAKQRKQVQDAVRSATFDVWTGKDDKVLRRLKITVDAAIPQSQRSQLGGLQSLKIVFDLTLSDIGKDQTISAPKNPKDLNELLSQLAPLFGGSIPGLGSGSGSSGSGSSGSSGSSGAAGAATDKYVQCLSDAGKDIAKAQKCAELLNG